MSYTLTQVLLKLVITCIIGVPAVLGIAWVWRQDLDVSKMLSPKRIVETVTQKPSFLATREESGIYQGGELRAVVEGVQIDEATSVVSFAQVSNSGSLDLGEPFEFRKYVLRFAGAETLIGMQAMHPEKGRVILKVRCKIESIR